MAIRKRHSWIKKPSQGVIQNAKCKWCMTTRKTWIDKMSGWTVSEYRTATMQKFDKTPPCDMDFNKFSKKQLINFIHHQLRIRKSRK